MLSEVRSHCAICPLCGMQLSREFEEIPHWPSVSPWRSCDDKGEIQRILPMCKGAVVHCHCCSFFLSFLFWRKGEAYLFLFLLLYSSFLYLVILVSWMFFFIDSQSGCGHCGDFRSYDSGGGSAQDHGKLPLRAERGKGMTYFIFLTYDLYLRWRQSLFCLLALFRDFENEMLLNGRVIEEAK